MNKFCVVSCFVVFVLAQITRAQYTLEEQNALQQEYLNPNNQAEGEEQGKDQDKRTIFPSTITNYGWAKHVGINTSGGKYVLGYSPVDLKYVPVVRPISGRPTAALYQLRPKWRPTTVTLKPAQKPQQGGWKPIYKPPTSVYGPPPSSPSSPKPPTPQEVSGGGGSDVFLQLPVKPAVPFKPTAVVPVVPVKPVVPVRPVFPVPVTPLQPVVPAAPLPPQVPPASPILFHVNRPNLPVLPLGASFPSPVLQPAALKPFVVPQPLPAPPPPPPPSIEFHGNHNYLRPAAPVFPTFAVPPPQFAVAAPAPPQFAPPPQFAIPAPPPPQFALPSPAPPQFALPSPPPPQFALPSPPPQFIPSPPAPPTTFYPYQGELPHQTPNVGLEQHDVQSPQHLYQQPEFSQQQQQQQQQQQEQVFQGIQPGQTDVQIPLHLPTHPHFRPVDLPSFQQSDFQTPFQTSANIIRPSIGLEPPFQRRREDVKVDAVEEGEGEAEEYEDSEEVLNQHK